MASKWPSCVETCCPITLVNIIFVTWTLIDVSYEFFHAEFKYVNRPTLSSTVLCDRSFQNTILANFLSRYQHVLNMAEILYYIFDTILAWKLKIITQDSRHVSSITGSQTVQAQTYSDTMGHETNSKFCLRNTAVLVVCVIMLALLQRLLDTNTIQMSGLCLLTLQKLA